MVWTRSILVSCTTVASGASGEQSSGCKVNWDDHVEWNEPPWFGSSSDEFIWMYGFCCNMVSQAGMGSGAASSGAADGLEK